MYTIAFLSQKGGAGKTTLATCVARQLQLEGEDVILVDSDPQGSARDWRAATDQDTVLVVGMDRPTLDKDIKMLSNHGKKWVIIDGAPRSEQMTISSIKAADVVIIPVQPSPYDIWAAEDLVSIVRSRQEITNGRPKAAFLISRAIKRTELGKEVVAALEGFDMPVLKAKTTQLITYPKSASVGLTPMDTEPDGNAAREIRSIVAELRAFVQM